MSSANPMTRALELAGSTRGDGRTEVSTNSTSSAMDPQPERKDDRELEERHLTRKNLRIIDSWIHEIETIEVACKGTKGRSDADSKLDDFQRYKLDLNDKLFVLKQDISTKKGIEDRVGTNAESIKLKSKIKKNLDDARRIQIKLDMSYKDALRDFDNGDSDMTVEEIRSRQELAELMAQDLEFVQNEFEPKERKKEGHEEGAFKLAYRGRERRREKRATAKDRGLVASEPQPLTAKQQAFIQESIERDRELDEKLSQIHAGVKMLGAIAGDINHELDVQKTMLEEVDNKMVNVTDKLETRNAEIKAMLEESGGATRWCPALVLCIILLACIGYIYNLATD